MLSTQIPDRFLPGFQTLASITAVKAKEIATFLEEIPVGTGNNTFVNFFNEKFPELIENDVALAVFSICGFNETDLNEISMAEIAEMLSDSFEEKTIKLEERQRTQLTENLEIILNGAGNIAATYKVFGLLSENERIFRDSRIISDLRFVFNAALENKDRKAVILHTLRLNIFENDERKNYYFSLDSNDLKKLKENIDRAIEKEELIKEQYGVDISIINVTE